MTILSSTLRLAVYSLSRNATTSSVLWPFIQSSFSWSAGRQISDWSYSRNKPRNTPRRILVRLISPTTSLFSRRASKREEHRSIPRRNDSNWRASVRIVMSSAGMGALGELVDNRGCCLGDCASNTFRTLVINFLFPVSPGQKTEKIKSNLLLVYSSSSLGDRTVNHLTA